MANVTISDGASHNHDDYVGTRAAGEDFTVNSGSTLVIDSCVHLTGSGILGDITINDGTVFLDGSRTKKVVYASGSGSIPSANPQAITWDSAASAGKIIRYDSGDSSTGTVTVTVDSGDTLAAGDTITDGSWSATVSSVAVGFLVVFGEDQDWSTTDLRALLKSRGGWYLAATGSGADSQTFELPHTGIQHDAWVESPTVESGTVTTASAGGTALTDSAATFVTNGARKGMVVVNSTDGSTGHVTAVVSETELTIDALTGGSDNGFGSGDSYSIHDGVWLDGPDAVFQIWHRIASGASASFYNDFADFSAYQDSGHVFQQLSGDATVTFGTSTEGGAPPNGARIVIPNVHLGTTTTAAPTTEVVAGAYTVFANIASGGGNYNLRSLNLSTVRLYVYSNGGACSLSDSCYGLSYTDNNSFGILSGVLTLSNVGFSNPGSVAGGNPFTGGGGMSQATGGFSISDCVFYSGHTSYPQWGWAITTCTSGTVTRCKLSQNTRDNSTNHSVRIGEGSSDLTFEDSVLNGAVVMAAGTNDVQFRDCRWGFAPGRTTLDNSWLAVTNCSNVRVNGWALGEGVALGTSAQASFIGSSDLDLRNCGSPASPVDLGATMYGVNIGLNATCYNTRVAHWWVTNNAGRGVSSSLVTNQNITLENCGGAYNSELELLGVNITTKGYRGASGGPGSATGVEDDLSAARGTCFYDCFTSDTAGSVGLVFCPPGTAHAADVTTVAGTPVWNGIGDLLLRTVGDQVIYAWPWWIKGHTAFQNAAASFAGTGTANLTYEYDLDTGSGYSGSWTEVSGANLSDETIAPTGFRIKFRITCGTAASTNALAGFSIATDSTLAAVAANLYPLDPSTITIHCVDAVTGADIVGAAVYLEAAAGGAIAAGTALLNTTTDANGEAELVIDVTADQPVTGVARKGSASPFYDQARILGITIEPGTDQTITAVMVPQE